MAEYTMCSRCEEKPAAICLSCLTDCTLKQQPIEGEFTKKIRRFVKMYENEIPKRAEITFLEEACDIIDQLQAPEQPIEGEFTKEMRERLDNKLWEFINRDDFYKALNRLDSAEARLKELPDLLSVCNDTLLALKKIKNTQKIDPFYLDTLIAVLDSAILKQSGCRPPVEGETDNPDPTPNHEFPAKAKKVRE